MEGVYFVKDDEKKNETTHVLAWTFPNRPIPVELSPKLQARLDELSARLRKQNRP